MTALRLAGRYFQKRLELAEVQTMLLAWNQQNIPPLSVEEIKRIVSDVERMHSKQGPQPDQLLRFPEAVMGGAAGQFALLFADYLEVPVEFFYMAYLTCLGSILSNRLTLASELRPQPRLYTLLLGESANDRKSTGLLKTIDFFKDVVEGFSVCWGVGSAEGLQKRLEGNQSLLLAFDEFKTFIAKCKIEASVLLPCVNTLFESNRYESRTKKTDIKLEDAHLSLLAASTVQAYERVWTSSFIDIGFVNRLFLVPGHGERKHSLPAKVPDKEKRLVTIDLQRLLSHVGPGRELDLTPGAKSLYHQWYMGLEKSVHSKRLDTISLRLMGLLTVNDLKSQVDEETASRVITLMDWQYRVREVHDPIDADNQTAAMEERIRRALKKKGTLSDRDLKRDTNAHRAGLWIYQAALKNVRDAREVKWNKEAKGWELN